MPRKPFARFFANTSRRILWSRTLKYLFSSVSTASLLLKEGRCRARMALSLMKWLSVIYYRSTILKLERQNTVRVKIFMYGDGYSIYCWVLVRSETSAKHAACAAND